MKMSWERLLSAQRFGMEDYEYPTGMNVPNINGI